MLVLNWVVLASLDVRRNSTSRNWLEDILVVHGVRVSGWSRWCRRLSGKLVYSESACKVIDCYSSSHVNKPPAGVVTGSVGGSSAAGVSDSVVAVGVDGGFSGCSEAAEEGAVGSDGDNNVFKPLRKGWTSNSGKGSRGE